MKKAEDAPPSQRQAQAAAALADLVAPKLERARRPFRSTKGQIERAREQMNAMSDSGDWGEACGIHLVALYEWLHEQVYEVPTAELDPKNWALAAQAAGRMVDQHFGGDYGRAVIFMRATWNRERETEQWRRENGRGGRRIGWRLMFAHGALITDYKLDCARAASKPKR